MDIICKNCSYKDSCKEANSRCPAYSELRETYINVRGEEAKAFIRRNRALLGIKDSEVSREYRSIAQKIIRTHDNLQFIEDFGIRIEYLKSYEEKTKDGKQVLGECIKVKELYKCMLPVDFIIVLYEPNISYMTKNQIKMLIWHELQHVDMGRKVGVYKLAPHDIEEFFAISEEYGSRWDEPGAKVPDITRNKSHER